MKTCAIIGSTKIAEIHVREFLRNGINDITVISRNKTKSKKFSENLTLKFKRKIKFSDLKIISNRNFNYISVCSNTKYHLENLKKLKNKKTKILVEKPLMPLKNITNIDKELDKIYDKYPNLFISYPMFYLYNFFIKNFKVDKKINSIFVYYQTRGNKISKEIFFDLAPHVLILIIHFINKKKMQIDSISSNIKKNSFAAFFKIIGVKIKIELLQIKEKKNSVFKFEINKKKIKRITKLENNNFTNYLEYKNKKKYLKNPMSSVIKNFVKYDKTSKQFKLNKNQTYQLSYLTKSIYDKCDN